MHHDGEACRVLAFCRKHPKHTSSVGTYWAWWCCGWYAIWHTACTCNKCSIAAASPLQLCCGYAPAARCAAVWRGCHGFNCTCSRGCLPCTACTGDPRSGMACTATHRPVLCRLYLHPGFCVLVCVVRIMWRVEALLYPWFVLFRIVHVHVQAGAYVTASCSHNGQRDVLCLLVFMHSA